MPSVSPAPSQLQRSASHLWCGWGAVVGWALGWVQGLGPPPAPSCDSAQSQLCSIPGASCGWLTRLDGLCVPGLGLIAAPSLLPPEPPQHKKEWGEGFFHLRWASRKLLLYGSYSLSLSSELVVLASLVRKEQFGEVMKGLGPSPENCTCTDALSPTSKIGAVSGFCIPGTSRPLKFTCQVACRSRVVHKWRGGWSGVQSRWKTPRRQEGALWGSSGNTLADPGRKAVPGGRRCHFLPEAEGVVAGSGQETGMEEVGFGKVWGGSL